MSEILKVLKVLKSVNPYASKVTTGGVLLKKVFLEISQNLHENTCLFCNFIKKETLAQAFSCEFCEISKNTLSTEHL